MNLSEIEKNFEEFFRDYYIEKINKAAIAGKKSVEIDFALLEKFDSNMADYILENPEEALIAANNKLSEILHKKRVFTRFYNLSESLRVKIKDLRSQHIGKMVAVVGIIKRATEVRPEIVSAKFKCSNCDEIISVEQKTARLKAPLICPRCSKQGVRFEIVDKEMTDLQIMTIEESPEDLEGGEQPSRISVHLRDDLVDPDFRKRIVPGNKVVVIGILREIPLKPHSKKFDIFIEANFVESIEREFEEIELDPQEENQILEISKRPDLLDVLSKSIAPSIYGYDHIKKAILLQLFSGVRKERYDKTVSRGDIHILLIGEPGTGKSMILKFVSKLAPKGRYVVGKGASAAGITASVVRDEMMEGFALEAGALVLANKGLCCIDEIDKMSPEDRSALHEGMEQQSITISKANIHATLQARTSILAAGNPKFGRFDPFKPIGEQINMPDALLSRFDLIFPVKDIPNKERDEMLAKHIIRMHREPEKIDVVIDVDLLRKYIAYARRNVKPVLTKEAEDEILKFYLGLRGKKSREGEYSVPLSPRQLEAIIRLSEAAAKCRLSDKVEAKDSQLAIEILTHSLREVGIDPETGEFDIDRIELGITSSQRNRMRVVLEIIEQFSEKVGEVPIEDVIAEAESRGIKDAEEIIEKINKEGAIYMPRPGYVRKL
jgi:replicative DNA helicase Mcm